MKDADREKAAKAARQAQAEFEAVEEQFDARIAEARRARRAKFKEAQDAGLTLREIGQAVGLHNTTVGEILRGD